MNNFEHEYHLLLERVLKQGVSQPSRAGDTISVFGEKFEITDLEHGLFPIVTSRQMFPRPIMGELFCFLQGYSDLESFKAAGCNYWSGNARSWIQNKGMPENTWKVGRIYGVQWRDWTNFEGVQFDQLYTLIDGLNKDPFGRRHIVIAWNPGEMAYMCLPPCHIMFQCHTRSYNFIDMVVYMRSVDLCLGLPSDIILYAALLKLICNTTVYGYKPGKLTFVLGDTHIYKNHIKTVKTQLQRHPQDLPKFSLDSKLDSFLPDDLELHDYTHYERLVYELNI